MPAMTRKVHRAKCFSYDLLADWRPYASPPVADRVGWTYHGTVTFEGITGALAWRRGWIGIAVGDKAVQELGMGEHPNRPRSARERGAGAAGKKKARTMAGFWRGPNAFFFCYADCGSGRLGGSELQNPVVSSNFKGLSSVDETSVSLPRTLNSSVGSRADSFMLLSLKRLDAAQHCPFLR